MPVVFHADPQSFLHAARPVASRSPCSEAFVAIWCAGLARHPPQPGEPCLLVTADEEGASAIAMQHGRQALLLENSDPAAACAIAVALADLGYEVPGVDGTPAACSAFADVWRRRTGRVPTERFRLRHHMLEDVSAVPVPSGAVRAADERDFDWLVRANDAFIAESKVPPPLRGTARLVRERLADARYRLWEDRGIVAFLGANLVDGGYARIGPVYTAREHRGRGYATALVAAASRELIARGGERVFLTTDLANPVSNAIYARVGFRPVHDSVTLDLVAS
ncbi:MAG TPA: GNAT family N-acetyltransferase [Casimicrobiaceae bacterium]|nr:GNAT family N-acetyltransferase [Casimicrobiaceae bacterium]